MGLAWITGAHGFIGRHLARHLASAGYTVYGLGHGHWPQELAAGWGLTGWNNGEITASNLDVLVRLTGKPDLVFHLAGGSSVGASLALPLEDFERTVATTARMLEWLRVQAPVVRLVVASSAAVYGNGYTSPIAESSPCRPGSPYGSHKLAMEELCRSAADSFGLRIAVVRLFSVYGGGLQKQLLWDLCERLAKRPETLELGGTGNEVRDWLHVADAVRMLLHAGESLKDSYLVLNGGTGLGTSVFDVASAVCRAWGIYPSLAFTKVSRRGDPAYLVADMTRPRTLGLEARISVASGVPEVVASYRTGHPA